MKYKLNISKASWRKWTTKYNKKIKSKKSTDFNYIDMPLIKDVMTFVVKPLTYIFNSLNRYFSGQHENS